jgi:hypothetical protein
MLHLRTWEGIPTFAAQLIRIIFQRVFQPALRPRYFNLSSGGARSSVGARTQRRLINFLCRSSCSSALLTSERRATTSSGVKSALALLSTAYSDEPVSIFPSERSRPVTHVPAQCGSLLPLPLHFRLSVANYACPMFPVHSGAFERRSVAVTIDRVRRLLSRAKSSTSSRVDLSGEPGNGLPFIRHAATFENGAHVRSASRTSTSFIEIPRPRRDCHAIFSDADSSCRRYALRDSSSSSNPNPRPRSTVDVQGQREQEMRCRRNSSS